MINSHRLRAWSGALLVYVAGWVGLSAQNQPPAGSETVKLPDLKVTDSQPLPPPESWRYGRVGNFEVISSASDNFTRKLLADFGMFTRAMTLVWPAPVKPMTTSTLILCGRSGKFDAFAPAGAAAAGKIVPSVLLRNRDQVAIVVDVETSRVAIDPANLTIANAASAEYEVDHYKALYREYVRFLISQAQTRAPIWLEEGLAQIVMDIDFNDERLIYGKINSRAGAESGGESADSDGTDPTANADAIVGEQPFNVVLHHRKLIPLGQFFATTADDPATQNPLGNNLWAKQAYLFVHFCLFGQDLRYQQPLATFVARLAREPLSEALFKECFKTDYKGMNQELWGYILRTKHKYQRYALKPEDKLTAKSIELRDATIPEAAVITGDALLLAGRPDEALGAYRAAYLRGSREPAILAGMGGAENALGHVDRARELLEAAVKGGAMRPAAQVELARLRLAEALAKPAASGKLDVTQMASVLTPLFEARKLPPPLPETYDVIAAAWAQSAAKPALDNLAVLDEGIRAFPRDSELLYTAALLYRDAGAPPIASSIARLGLRFNAEPATRARFEQLLASLPPAPPAK
jgi:hypothetical protein